MSGIGTQRLMEDNYRGFTLDDKTTDNELISKGYRRTGREEKFTGKIYCR